MEDNKEANIIVIDSLAASLGEGLLVHKAVMMRENGNSLENTAKWIEDQGLQMNGSMFNIYHTSPAQDPNPDNWVTEACFPIK